MEISQIPGERKSRRFDIQIPAVGSSFDVEDVLHDPGTIETSALAAHKLTVGDHGDVDLTGNAAGKVLMWDGTNFVPADTHATDLEVSSAVAAHSADTTSVHGIPDTSALVTDGDAAGGDLGGTFPSPTLSAAKQAEIDAKETPAGSQSKADAAESDANAYTDTRVTKAVIDLLGIDAATLQGSTLAQVQSAITAAIVDSAPATLDTLNELAAALGDDPNLATTLTSLISAHVNDTTAAHAATAIGFTPTGGLAADDVQEALAELDTEKSATSHNHDAAYPLKSLWDANSILKADSDDTPAALTVVEQRLVGRKSGGQIAALTPEEVVEILQVVTSWGFPFTIDPILLRGTDATSIAINTTTFYRCHHGGTISKIGLRVNTSSGNISLAAYRNTGLGRAAVPGARLATTGAIACPAAGYTEVSLGATITLLPGDWFALSVDNATAAFVGSLAGAATNNMGLGRTLEMTGTHPAPTTPAGLVAIQGRAVALIGVP